MEKDYSISFVRFIAMLLIIICHIFQYYNNELAWWFNVGVQIFLFISGVLYSKKEVKNVLEFYKKEFFKILVPYYIYIFIVFMFYFLFNRDLLSVDIVFRTILLIGTPIGLEHLWFIKYILICYLIIPILIKVFKEENISFKTLLKFFCCIAFFEIISFVTKNYINGTWINCFILGYFIHRYNINKRKRVSTFFCIISIILISIKIIIKYVINYNFWGIFSIVFGKYSNICHLLLGCILFYLLSEIYMIISKKMSLKWLLEISDKNSYYVYMVHHIFILGPYSILNININIFISILLLMGVIVLSAIILKKIVNCFNGRFLGERNKKLKKIF